jgi:hypothetical protein
MAHWICTWSAAESTITTRPSWNCSNHQRFEGNSTYCLLDIGFRRYVDHCAWLGCCSHLRRIDHSLPAKYIRRLYGPLPRSRAYLLMQLRSGHCWLATYAKAFRFRDDDLCVCGERESVTHVLLDCPDLKDLRRELRTKAGDAFSSVSALLGGSEEGRRGKPNHSSKKWYNLPVHTCIYIVVVVCISLLFARGQGKWHHPSIHPSILCAVLYGTRSSICHFRGGMWTLYCLHLNERILPSW